MGVTSQSTVNTQNSIAQQQEATAQQYANLATQSLGKMNTLTQPAINYDTGLVNAANSGNYSQLIQSAGSQLGTISQQYDAAKNNIMASTPNGPGRSQALALLPAQQANAVSSTLNQQYNQALGNLTQIGTAYAGQGIQEAGANLSGLSGAANTTSQVGQEQAAGKSDLLGFAGQLAGVGGSVASKFIP